MKEHQLKLMIPGPIQPADEVLEVMGSPVQPHYGPMWRDQYNEMLRLLKMVFNTEGDVFCFVGSGSSALDAALGNMVPGGGKIILGINGFFGERLKAIAECYNLRVVPVTAEWGQPIDPDDVLKVIQHNPDASALAVVHLETSTTIINPVEEIGKVANAKGIPFIVDAVSSLGGLPLKMDDWGIDICASASQKCLGAPPGLAPIAVSEKGWKAIAKNPNPGHGWYLNLNIWKKYATEWADWHPHPITMATNNIFALKIALEGLLKEGLETRLNRYRALAVRLRAGLRRIGMPPYTPDDRMAPVLTGAYGPQGIPTGDIVEYLADVYHIKISGGLGALKDKIIRIGHMSPTVTETDIDEVITALEHYQLDRHIKSSGG